MKTEDYLKCCILISFYISILPSTSRVPQIYIFFKSQESTDNKIGSYLSKKKNKTINRVLISQSRLEGTGIEMKELQTIPTLFYNID